MKGRPPSRNKGLRDGFYLEVFNKGANVGIKIRKETEVEMLAAVEEYRRENKTVSVLGPHKKGVWLDRKEAEDKGGKKKAGKAVNTKPEVPVHKPVVKVAPAHTEKAPAKKIPVKKTPVKKAVSVNPKKNAPAKKASPKKAASAAAKKVGKKKKK